MTCEGKECFGSFALAERIAKLSNMRHTGYRLQAYKCRCGSFHVGSSIARTHNPRRRFYVLDEAA